MNELRIDTLLGEVRLIGSEQALHAICFSGQAWEHATPTRLQATAVLEQAARWVLAALDGTGAASSPPRATLGTPFQRRVWDALLEIPRGSTRSYGELARTLDQASAARALGAAVGRNPWSLLVPCHRVLGAAGALTGYAGGLGRKRALLALEAGLPLPWYRLTQSYAAQYTTPMRLRPGARVRWQARADDGEFPGWSFALDEDGLGAWVPRVWFGGDAHSGSARRSYDSTELDVQAGEQVLELDRFGGWVLARHADGRRGWLPQTLLQPAARQTGLR